MTKEQKKYLDELRVSGYMQNMFGAVPNLMEEFGLDKDEARSVLKEWMDTFK